MMSAMPMDDRATSTGLYLHPGQLAVTSEPIVITTILGSCVAVCLWDAGARVAGMNHFLLPRNPEPGTDDARYGDTAVEALVDAVAKRVPTLDRVVAKVFGGACVLPGANGHSIGTTNIEIARERLQRRGIAIAIDQTGGQRGRKLLFDATTGTAWVKEI